jgi:hypothetical protein
MHSAIKVVGGKAGARRLDVLHVLFVYTVLYHAGRNYRGRGTKPHHFYRQMPSPSVTKQDYNTLSGGDCVNGASDPVQNS